MSTKNLRLVENLIMLTFPLALFAGCAGSDIKPTEEVQSQYSAQETGMEDKSFPAMETETPSLVQLDDHTTNANTEKTADSVSTLEKEVESIKSSAMTAAISIPKINIFYFDTNDHTLTTEQRLELKQHAEYLLANPDAVMEINGHADERGSDDYNQTLSEKRATEAYRLLIEYGVSENQLLAKGFGEKIPVNKESNWDENRRVELQYTNPVVLSSR